MNFIKNKFVIALVTKGLILKEQGKLEEARKYFIEAEQYETNPVLLNRISELKEDQKSIIRSHSNTNNLRSFFENHEIIKNKLCLNLIILNKYI